MMQFHSLKDDFQYNLGLLEERDRDLERYESMLQNMMSESAEKDALLNQMRTELSELNSGAHTFHNMTPH
jgi:hypothetical protein